MKAHAVIGAAALLTGCAAPTTKLELSFVGDILLDSKAGRGIAAGRDPFEPTKALRSGVDFSLGNLECPVATGGTLVEKVYNFRADPSTLPTLHRHFDAVSVANNHSGDYGPVAFTETLEHLDQEKVGHFGGGRDLEAAHQPLFLEKNGIKIALLGYDGFLPRSFEATTTRPGVAWVERAQIALDIERARQAGARVVLPFFHWGWENEPEPCAEQRELAHALIDAGASAVIGAHPHVTQGVEMYRGRPIIYSLGNFVFDLLDEPLNAHGWLLKLQVDRDGVATFKTFPVQIDDQGIPSPERNAVAFCGARGDSAPSRCPD